MFIYTIVTYWQTFKREIRFCRLCSIELYSSGILVIYSQFKRRTSHVPQPALQASREDREEGKTKKGLGREGSSLPFSHLLHFSPSPLPLLLPFLRRQRRLPSAIHFVACGTQVFNSSNVSDLRQPWILDSTP